MNVTLAVEPELGKSTSPMDVCRLARISENTLRSYLRQYQEGGVERLKRTDWDGPTSELSDHRQTIEEHFRKDPPRSTPQAAAEIERLTGVRRGLTQVRKLWMIPAKADADVQREFLDERLWPRLRQARWLRRVVCFVDAAHFVHGTFLGYVWCFTRLLIRGPSGRRRFVLAAVRRECWGFLDIRTSARDPSRVKMPRPHLDRLLNAVCYAH